MNKVGAAEGEKKQPFLIVAPGISFRLVFKQKESLGSCHPYDLSKGSLLSVTDFTPPNNLS